MSFFKDHVAGIFILSVTASVAASYLWEERKELQHALSIWFQEKSLQVPQAISNPAPVASDAAHTAVAPAPSSRVGRDLTSPRSDLKKAQDSASKTVTVLQPGPTHGKDIWTTSVYSNAPGGGGPGGGLHDERLIVGGWGDNYYSLLQFNLAGMPAKVKFAKLELYCFKQRASGTVGIYLDRVTSSWDWRTRGTCSDHDRLWWADRPSATQWIPNALPPCHSYQWYGIDITDLYNKWQDGTYQNFGLQLRPTANDNRWSEFYSSNYLADPSLRPRLVVQD